MLNSSDEWEKQQLFGIQFFCFKLSQFLIILKENSSKPSAVKTAKKKLEYLKETGNNDQILSNHLNSLKKNDFKYTYI